MRLASIPPIRPAAQADSCGSGAGRGDAGQPPCAIGAPDDAQTYMQANRNSQTTSTKCQYQAAASKPKCFCGVNPPPSSRIRQTVRKMVPISTWKPWKPVAMMKLEP